LLKGVIKSVLRVWHALCLSLTSFGFYPKDPHGPRNVLELLIAHILEGQIELIAHLVPNFAGDTNTTGVCQRFQA
jgi:hypothetical protein